jgi:glucokinase
MAVIAFDLGGTKLAAAIFSDEGEVIWTETVQLQNREGNEVGALIVAQANHLREKAKALSAKIHAVCICIPGIAYARTGHVWAPNIRGWENYPLRQELEEAIDDSSIAIHIDSDRACYILAEVWKGVARGCSDAIFLNVGTGIGAGILADGIVLRGKGDIAGAIGWMTLQHPYDNKYAPCGCFEYNASGAGLVRVAKDFLKEKKFTNSPLYQSEPGSITAKDIFEGYDRNDQLAIMVINNAIIYWGMAVANLVSLFNPEKIIFGGGVFGPALKFLDEIYDEARKWAQPISIGQVKLEGAALGSSAGLYGAAYLALKNREG